jgi:serpin B
MFRFGFGSARQANPLAAASVAESNTAFALELYREFGRTQGNLFFSPYSISICLAIGYAGARGETAKQMGRVLHLDAGPEKVHAAFRELQRLLREVNDGIGCELSVANALWKQRGHPFLPA